MRRRILYALLIIFLIVLLDQYTKHLIRIHVDPYETVRVLPVINLVNVKNTGAAFGTFRHLGNTFFIVISVAALLFMFWVIAAGKEDYRIFSVLAGGAAGNLIDRVTLGYVVDFIDFTVSGYHWPAFNAADSSLTIGIFLIIIRLMRKKKTEIQSADN